MISKNIEDTEKIAKEFLKKIRPIKTGATVVGLYGDLGTGKTTFTQFVAESLGVKNKVNSPTYVIMKKYKIQAHPNPSQSEGRRTSPPTPLLIKGEGRNFKYLFHLDAYRLKNEKELSVLGWEEIISNKEHLVFMEWPENIKKAMPKKHHQIHIRHLKEGYRKFEIN